MKKIQSAFAATLLLLTLASCGTSRSVVSDEQQKIIQAGVSNREFQVEVNRAFPLGEKSINLTTPYSLRIQGDSVYSYLPYFGRAYSVPYGGGSGLNFNGILTGYQVQQGRRNATIVSFDVKSPDDRLKYYIEIWPGGSSSIRVTPQNRQQIGFEGDFIFPKK